MEDPRYERHRWTYALLAEPLRAVKIGSASVPRFGTRLAEVQTLCPVELVLIGSLDRNIERGLHRQFRYERLHGEWFCYSRRVAQLIGEMLTPRRIPMLSDAAKSLTAASLLTEAH